MSSKHQLTDQVKLLQKIALIRRQDGQVQVLLLKRSARSMSRPNAWDLPGGNSEWPATTSSVANLHLDDVVRELAEETGLKLSKTALELKQLSHFSSYFDAPKQVYTIIVGWWVDVAAIEMQQTEIQLSEEHQAYAWVSLSELQRYDFGGAQGSFVVDMIHQAFARFSSES